MKFSITKEELNTALSVAITGVGVNSTLPIMAGIYLKAQDKTLTLESTNLDYSCKVECAAFVEEDGEAVLPGKLFYDIVRSFEDAKVSIVTDDTKAFITCEQAAFSTNVLNASEFPGFPSVTSTNSVTMNFEKFQAMIKKVIKATSKDASKGIFTGVYFEAGEGKVRAVTTDLYRLAVAEEKIEDAQANFNMVIPPHFLNEISSLSSEGKDVTIGFDENQVIIKVGGFEFINRRLQGNWPDYRRLIKATNPTTVVVSKQKLLAAIKRVSILRSDNIPLSIAVDVDKQMLQLSVNASGNGVATELVGANCDGEACSVGFDTNYVLDGLSSINTNDVMMTFSPSKDPSHIVPCVVNEDNFSFDDIRETEENLLKNKYLYLAMPVIQ